MYEMKWWNVAGVDEWDSVVEFIIFILIAIAFWSYINQATSRRHRGFVAWKSEHNLCQENVNKIVTEDVLREYIKWAKAEPNI